MNKSLEPHTQYHSTARAQRHVWTYVLRGLHSGHATMRNAGKDSPHASNTRGPPTAAVEPQHRPTVQPGPERKECYKVALPRFVLLVSLQSHSFQACTLYPPTFKRSRPAAYKSRVDSTGTRDERSVRRIRHRRLPHRSERERCLLLTHKHTHAHMGRRKLSSHRPT